MTDDQIRIAIAEACGWKSPFNEREWLYNSGSEGEDVYGKFVGTDPFGDREQVPNYPFDLNACAEFEKTLTDEEHFSFRKHLWDIVIKLGPEDTWDRQFVSADAKTRCLAYLKTKGIIP